MLIQFLYFFRLDSLWLPLNPLEMVCTVIRDRLWALDFSCMFTDEGYVTINYHTLKSHDLRGVILSLPLSPLVILQDSPWQFISAHSPLRNVPLGGRLHWEKEEFFQSAQHNHPPSACMCAYGSSGQNVSRYTLRYFSPITAKEADQILVVIATFWMS